jgi:hypothetical protein
VGMYSGVVVQVHVRPDIHVLETFTAVAFPGTPPLRS